MQLDDEVLALEAQLADLRPAERVDFGISLKCRVENVPIVCPAAYNGNTTTLLGRVAFDVCSAFPSINLRFVTALNNKNK